MNLVVGATGLLGGEICRQLTHRGEPTRALVRRTSNPVKVNQLRGLGAELVHGDLKDRASLDAACHRVDAVISTASSTLARQEGDSIASVDRDGQLALVDAAAAAGVKRFILISFPEIAVEFPLQSAKRAVEARLRQSGMAYTVLRPTMFAEVWLSPMLGFDLPNATVRIYGDGENRISWISLRDVARFAVAALDNPEANHAVIKLGGPEALSPMDVVRLAERTIGRSIDVQRVPERALRDQFRTAPDALQQSFAALMLSYAAGEVIDMTETLHCFPGAPLRSVQDYLEDLQVSI